MYYVKPLSLRDPEAVGPDLTCRPGPGFVNFEQGTVVPSLVGNAYGLVLDLGAGSGNQLPRLDASKIKHVYGIESNPAFASALVAKIKETGLEAKYTPVIGCIKTAEAELARYGVIPGTIDCILSIQLLCSVQDITATVQQLHRLLKPGGELIFWEHQRNEVDFVTRMVQGIVVNLGSRLVSGRADVFV